MCLGTFEKYQYNSYEKNKDFNRGGGSTAFCRCNCSYDSYQSISFLKEM